MTLRGVLQRSKDAILRRWFEEALATYPAHSSAAFRRQKDPFANPIGYSLRVGTRGIFEALVEEANAEKIRQHLHDIIKIRAVQQFSASQAVGFVFGLKEAIRLELGEAISDPQFASEFAELEREIDGIALAAFDSFVECREQVCQLRINEVKRRVSWVVEKMNGGDFDPESAEIDSSEGA